MVEMMLRQEELKQLRRKGSISTEEAAELIGLNEFLSAEGKFSSEEHVQKLIEAQDELIDMEFDRLTYGGN
jgi:hypothetical protein